MEDIELTETIKVLEEYGERIVSDYKASLKAKDHIATGKLYSSIKTLPIEINGDTYTLNISLEDYAKWVENGRGPGKRPPYNKILQWIKDKPVIPYAKNGKLPTEKQLAFLISRSIGENGIKPSNDLKNTMDDIYTNMRNDLQSALETDLNQSLDTIEIKFEVL